MTDLTYTVMLIGVFVVLALGIRWLNRGTGTGGDR